MANKYRGELSTNIGGRDRIIKFTLNDLADLQDHCDRPLKLIFDSLEDMDVKIIRTLLYFGLRNDDPELTERAVGSWDMNITEVIHLVSQSLERCFGAGEDKKGSKKKKKT